MNNLVTAPGIILTILLPLLLAMLMGHHRSRPLAKRLIPIAALPAIILAAWGETSEYTLPGFMLGGMFVLDATSRLFLLLGGTLLTVAAVISRTDAAARRTHLSDVLLLLFIAALMITILAADTLTYYTGVTMAGYILYALVWQHGSSPGHEAGRVFVVMLVISDILVFELLLLLGEHSSSHAFAALQAGLLKTGADPAILLLMLLGFGIKAGIVGVHFWLAPALSVASHAVRPLIIGFIFCAGMLAGLRMLPMGLAAWPNTGEALQWLAWLMLTYATVIGLLQRHYGALIAYVAMVLTALWLMLGGMILAQPFIVVWLQPHWYFALAQSVFALTALLLIGRRLAHAVAGQPGSANAMGLVAALSLALTPMTLIAAASPSTQNSAITMMVMGMALAVLSSRIWRLRRNGEGPSTTSGIITFSASVLALAAVISAVLGWPGVAWADAALMIGALAIAALAGWYIDPIVRYLPAVPPGDLVHLLRMPLRILIRFARHAGLTWLPRRTQRLADYVKRDADAGSWSRQLRTLEITLTRWVIGAFLLVVIGFAIAIVSLIA